ncbi:hypothetical protein WUBG_12085, partial [Wuchereria bancrofti]
ICGKQLETERVTYSRLETGKMAFASVVATTSCYHPDLRPHREGSDGTLCPRLVPDGMCGHNQRKIGEAPPQTWSCGERRGCSSPLHFRLTGLPRAANLSLPNSVLHPVSNEIRPSGLIKFKK